ncbi:MAG: HlyD family efflux transporter periplasmic adaptor subunit [Phycisphaerales bacterium]
MTAPERAVSAPPTASASVDPQALAPKLREVQVGLRKDLQVARHLFRGNVTYTVRDPVSYETHAFGAGDYAVLVAITGERTLRATFESLVQAGVVTAGDEESFYKFVLALHRAGLLALPISDDRSLVMRYESREVARRKARLLAALYYKIPIWNPDAFLVRTLAFGSKLYTRTAFLGWVILMVAAVVALAARWHDIGAQLPTLFASEQLLTMWVLLVGLKVVHEFGHAYACRTFGGEVPEMGATLVMLTPCAYVDASSSWNFPRLRDRLIVCLGGMYFESWVAAFAAIYWAFSEPGVAHGVAYQTMVLASVTTVAFNINPLMRFDGYFILSDLLQVPNLRSQSMALVRRWMKRVFVGVDPGGPTWSPAMTCVLLAYGIAASIYRVAVVVGMCAAISIKFFVVGVALGIAYGGTTLVKTVFGALQYLLVSKETESVRPRAYVVAALLLVVPALVVSIPMPRNVWTQGVLRREHEQIVTAESPGFLRSIAVGEGARVESGAAIVGLESVDLESERDRARAESEVARLALGAADASSPIEQAIAADELRLAEDRRLAAERHWERLTVRAPIGGTVVTSLDESERGRFVAAGTSVATITDGGWIATALVDQHDLSALRLRGPDDIELRLPSDPSRLLRGRLLSVSPAGDAAVDVDLHALTLPGGGDIAVSPMNGRAESARFVVRVAIDGAGDDVLRGERVTIRLPGRRTSLVTGWYHAVLRFRERLASVD